MERSVAIFHKFFSAMMLMVSSVKRCLNPLINSFSIIPTEWPLPKPELAKASTYILIGMLPRSLVTTVALIQPAILQRK